MKKSVSTTDGDECSTCSMHYTIQTNTLDGPHGEFEAPKAISFAPESWKADFVDRWLISDASDNRFRRRLLLVYEIVYPGKWRLKQKLTK